MENHPHEGIDTVLNCVIPYIQNGDDRNSVSSVCRKWYELDCMTRKHVTVHMFYSTTPSRLHQRFPFLESLTLEGLPRGCSDMDNTDITPWIQEISVSFKFLKALNIRRMVVDDSDLELLARTRGKDLSVLMIKRCKWFSTNGLWHIGKYCNDLRTLCLKDNIMNRQKDGKWLHELALHNTGIESLDIRGAIFRYDAKDLSLIAKNCSQSLVSFKFTTRWYPIDLVDFFSYAVRLEDFSGGSEYIHNEETVGLKFPPNMRCVDAYFLTNHWFPSVLTLAHQIRELKFTCVNLDLHSWGFLIERCPNLEVLHIQNDFGSIGPQVIGQCCKKLRKFKNSGFLTQMGLINVAQGCLKLECLHIELVYISNESLECIATHLKNLRDFHMSLNPLPIYSKTYFPVDNGIRAMLTSCSKLERLSIHLRPLHSGLTDVGLGYIGKYGRNLRYLSLGYIEESASGLVCLSKGCLKLRKLEIRSYPFSKETLAPIIYDMHMLRYLSVRDVNNNIIFAMTRPDFKP